MIKLALVGREYNDTIINCSGFIKGETNNIDTMIKKGGGVFNIPSTDGITRKYFPCGLKGAIIINDISNSTRTSFTQTLRDDYEINIDKIKECDWVHIAYVDDIPDKILELLVDNELPNMSIDFCKIENRKKYIDIIKKSSLIFDSRERKELWRNLTPSVPIILHDPDGCECFYGNVTMYEADNEKIENLQVNGAGDIFASYFIKTYHDHNLKTAVYNSCAMTTIKLQEMNEV